MKDKLIAVLVVGMVIGIIPALITGAIYKILGL